MKKLATTLLYGLARRKRHSIGHVYARMVEALGGYRPARRRRNGRSTCQQPCGS